MEDMRVGLDKDFIQVVDGDRIYFGGNQAWFGNDQDYKGLAAYGCGLIALANLVLYLNGKRRLSKEEYICTVNEYMQDPRLQKEMAGRYLIPGLFPSTLRRLCTSRVESRTLKARWRADASANIADIERMLREGIPVVMSIGSGTLSLLDDFKYATNQPNQRLKLNYYRWSPDSREDGENFTKVLNSQGQEMTIYDHYVTVTALVRDFDSQGQEHRYFEISTWGQKAYVRVDDYQGFVLKSRRGFIHTHIERKYWNGYLSVKNM
ncbi:MAG: hypothetical protein K5773_06945 [Pseudobutyrivibrio sp.]|nr:hypothetical protein [Pseudobutyrivibrio sp.]